MDNNNPCGIHHFHHKYLEEKYQKNLKYEIYKMNNAFYMQIPERNQQLNAVMGEFGQISDVAPEKIGEYGIFLGSVII